MAVKLTPGGQAGAYVEDQLQEQMRSQAAPDGGTEAIREFLGGSDRPKSAVYVPRQCREHRPGAGGSPLPTARPSRSRQRPSSARHAGGTLGGGAGSGGGGGSFGGGGPASGAKTERWREAGQMRWPAPVETKKGDQQDTIPFRQTTDYEQGNWKNELWMRSLRKPGLLIQAPVFAVPGAEIQQMHEEWRSCPPFSPRSVPYCGSTASGRAAMPNENDPLKWVEKPVAVGKYALKHMDGGRYKFDNTPRFYQDHAAQASPKPSPGGRRAASASGATGTGVTQSRRWKAKLCQP